MDADADAILTVRDLTKSFGETRALRGVGLNVAAGEVLGLVGGNGAGKSTLLKIVTGVYQADRGTMVLAGQDYRPRSPFEAAERHIALIPQELRVVPAMSVADNVMLGHWPRRGALPLVDARAARAEARARLAALGLDIDPRAEIGSLPFAARQSVVIARAVARDARLLILDEPTAALGEAEVDRLFDLIARLKARGTAVIYVSHRLDEIERLCDRVVALRDGQVVASLVRGGYRLHDLVVAISGQPAAQAHAHTPTAPGPALVAADAPGGRLALRAGRIGGLHGLLGSGIEDLLRGLFGAGVRRRLDTPAGAVDLTGPARAIAAGLGYVPSERRRAIVPALSVRDNIVLPHLARYARAGTLDRRALDAAVVPLMERLDIRPRNPALPAGTLSGGNQQKVLFARWLLGTTHSLLLDEPTHGVDVGAKALIKAQIRAFAAAGGGVLMHSVELDDLTELVDELFLMIGGRLTAPQERPAAGYDTIALKELACHTDPMSLQPPPAAPLEAPGA